MVPTYAAALAVIRESFSMLEEAVADVPPDALDWRPWEGANSLAVLVMHAVTSTRFLCGAAAGRVGSFEAYRDGERAAAFRATGLAPGAVDAAINAVERDLTEWFSAAGEHLLESAVSLPGTAADGATGTWLLFRAIGHLREHVGHAQAVRDLSLAQGR